MPDRRLIYKKLEEILKQLKYLRKLSRLTERELIFQETQQFLAERVMERLISAAIDINMHIMADLTGEVPAHYFTSFIELARLKIYPPIFCKKNRRLHYRSQYSCSWISRSQSQKIPGSYEIRAAGFSEICEVHSKIR